MRKTKKTNLLLFYLFPFPQGEKERCDFWGGIPIFSMLLTPTQLSPTSTIANAIVWAVLRVWALWDISEQFATLAIANMSISLRRATPRGGID